MNKGFTLIELLITITVITIGIAGAFLAVQQGISTVDYSRSRLTAAFLAQEAVEIIKNIRDTNLLQKTVAWNQGLDPGINPKEYEVEYSDVQDEDVLLSEPACSPSCDFDNLNYLKKTDDGFYNYTLGDDTRYKRKVQIEKIDSEHLTVTITVYWKTRKGHRELQLIQEMYKWW